VGSGIGTIICTGVNSCGSGSSDTISINPSVSVGAATAISTSAMMCSGNIAIFTTPAITNATSYIWTISGTGWSGTGTSASADVTVGTGTGTITVEGNGPCGPGTPFTLSGITVQPSPAASFSLAAHVESVGGNDVVTYTGTTTPTGLYAWNFAGGVASPGIGVGPHLVHWAAGGLKTITLTVTDSGCTSNVYSDTVLVEVPTHVQMQEFNQFVKLFPNPNSGIFSLEFSDNIAFPAMIQITDIKGKVVYQNKLDGVSKSLMVDLGNLSSGIYPIHVEAGNVKLFGKIDLIK